MSLLSPYPWVPASLTKCVSDRGGVPAWIVRFCSEKPGPLLPASCKTPQRKPKGDGIAMSENLPYVPTPRDRAAERARLEARRSVGDAFRDAFSADDRETWETVAVDPPWEP
jgi:hypothetical protein